MIAPKAAAPTSARPAAGAPEISQMAGLALLMAITFLWGINWPAMKTAVGDIPPWTFRVICLATGGLGMLAIARLAGLPFRIPRAELRPLLAVAFFNITIWHIASAAGLTHISASRASIIAFTMPLWATVLAVFLLGERVNWRVLLGLALGLAGLAALVLPDLPAMMADPLGFIFMLAAAIAWAIGTVLAKHYRFTMPVSVFAGWQIMLGGIPIVLGMLIFERDFDPAQVGAPAWATALYAAFIPTIFCQWAWFKLVRSFPAIAVSIGTLMIPVIGVLSSALALGEPIGPPEIVSLALILAALFIVLILPALGMRTQPVLPQPPQAPRRPMPWVDSAARFDKDPSDRVVCPACGKDFLAVHDVPFHENTRAERYFVCPTCKAMEVAFMNIEGWPDPTAKGRRLHQDDDRISAALKAQFQSQTEKIADATKGIRFDDRGRPKVQ